MKLAETRTSAWSLSRRFKLAPHPQAGPARAGDRLEIAWDGHRVLACRAGTDVRIFSSDFREWTKNFPAVVAMLGRLSTHELVLDGFICALDASGRPSFAALRAHITKPSGARIVFAPWDVLLADGEDLTAQPLSTRAARLEKILANAKEPLVISQALEGAPNVLLKSLASIGVRGLVARALASTYPPKEEAAWTCTATGEPIAWDRSISAAPAITNRDKVLYPRDGITKNEIAAYYQDVSPLLLAHLRDRPVVCQRWPDGIDEFTWYQHRMPPRAPDYLRAVWIEGGESIKSRPTKAWDIPLDGKRRKIRRVVIENVDGLVWMVNQAALTFHGWASRVASLASPDWVILDLDPGEATKWETVIDVALAIRKLLEMLELPSVVKTSGKKGLHILVPLAPGHTVTQAHELAMRMSMLVARLYPDDVSLEATSETRRGRLYLDHLQNFEGKSLVLPYSLRDRDGATASTPIGWDEVDKKLDPRAFTMRTMRARLDQKGDLSAPLLAGTTRIAAALSKLK